MNQTSLFICLLSAVSAISGTEIRFNNRIFKKVTVKPTDVRVFVFMSKTEEVVFNREQEYETLAFTVRNCLLKNVPKDLDHLKLLVSIDLSHNRIETVSMDFFNNFVNLQKLELQNNRISALTTAGPIILPRLNLLWLSSNELSDLDVCQWQMPSLETLYLKNNYLAYVLDVLKKFPNLSTISLHDNDLNCDWSSRLENGVRNSDGQIKLLQALDCQNDSPAAPTGC